MSSNPLSPFATPGFATANLPAHLFMPPSGFPFDNAGYVNLPAVGQIAAIVTFTVPEGFNGVIVRLGNTFNGTGWTEGSGSLVYQIAADGGVIRGYDNIIASLGAINNPPPVSGIMIKEQQTIVLQVSNVSLAVGGAQAGGRLSGWFYPTSLEPEGMWL